MIGKGPETEILCKEFSDVFKPGLGTLQGFKATIQVDKEASPVFCKAHSVPYAMTPLVEKELDRLQQEGVIAPFAFSDWVAPIVPVLKGDKSVRICGDFKMTVNKVSKLDRYPIPKIEDLFAKLAGGGKLFTKLDLSQAYQQICLEEESKKLLSLTPTRGCSSSTDCLLEYHWLQPFFKAQWNYCSRAFHMSLFTWMISL